MSTCSVRASVKEIVVLGENGFGKMFASPVICGRSDSTSSVPVPCMEFSRSTGVPRSKMFGTRCRAPSGAW